MLCANRVTLLVEFVIQLVRGIILTIDCGPSFPHGIAGPDTSRALTYPGG